MNQTELNKARIAEYNKAHVNDSAFSICDEWDESKHPRAANGQFGSGGASSAPTKASKAPAKANTSTPAKKPAQAKSTNSRKATEAIAKKYGAGGIDYVRSALAEAYELGNKGGNADAKKATEQIALKHGARGIQWFRDALAEAYNQGAPAKSTVSPKPKLSKTGQEYKKAIG